MTSYIMMTKLASGSLRSPQSLVELEKTVMERIRNECPDIDWLCNFAVLGPYDYVDIFETPKIDTAMKVATIIRTYGHASTEIWPAKAWPDYKEMIRGLPAEAA